MVRFIDQKNGTIVCANDYGFVFGKIVEVECFKTSKKTYAYFPINNTDVHFGDELLAIYEKINCLNESLDKKIVSCETNIEIQDLVVNFLDEENGDIVCKNDNGITIGVILKSPLLGNYVYFILNENINIETQKIIEDKTNKLNEENKDEVSKNISNELEKMQNARLNKSSNDKDEEEQPYLKEVLNQRQKTHGEFSEVSKTYADFIKILEKTGFFNKCEDHHRLAIDVIFQKLARILNGDMNFYDHWVDICGYSELVKKELDKNKKQD